MPSWTNLFSLFVKLRVDEDGFSVHFHIFPYTPNRPWAGLPKKRRDTGGPQFPFPGTEIEKNPPTDIRSGSLLGGYVLNPVSLNGVYDGHFLQDDLTHKYLQNCPGTIREFSWTDRKQQPLKQFFQLWKHVRPKQSLRPSAGSWHSLSKPALTYYDCLTRKIASLCGMLERGPRPGGLTMTAKE